MTLRSSGMGRRFQLFGSVLLIVAIAMWMFANPATAAVTGTATPSTGLGVTGTLAVTASGFGTSLNTVFVIECVHGATDSSQCDANTEDGNLDADTSGNYSNPAYVYYQLPNAVFDNIDSITCDATHLCDLVVIQDDYNNFSNPHVNIPITFAGGGATTTSAATSTTAASTTTTTRPATTTTTTTLPTTTTTGAAPTTTTTTAPTTTTTGPATTTTTTTLPTTTTTGAAPTTTTTTAPTTTTAGPATTTTTLPMTTTTGVQPATTTTTTTPSTTTTGTTNGSTTTTTQPTANCRHNYGHQRDCCSLSGNGGHGYWSLRFCKHGHGDHSYDSCACGLPPHRPKRGYGSQGGGHPGSYTSVQLDKGGKLPDQGAPAAATIIVAVCGLVILLAGTLMRRVLLPLP